MSNGPTFTENVINNFSTNEDVRQSARANLHKGIDKKLDKLCKSLDNMHYRSFRHYNRINGQIADAENMFHFYESIGINCSEHRQQLDYLRRYLDDRYKGSDLSSCYH